VSRGDEGSTVSETAVAGGHVDVVERGDLAGGAAGQDRRADRRAQQQGLSEASKVRFEDIAPSRSYPAFRGSGHAMVNPPLLRDWLDRRMQLDEQSLSAGEPWYASTTLWAVAAVVVALVAIPVATWAAFRSARPRRALYISVDQAASLLRTKSALDGHDLTVSLDGRALTALYVATVNVVSDSVLDIAPAAFSGAPLELDFGVPILTLLGKTSDAGRTGVRDPAVQVRDTALHVGPALLTRRHRLRYTVLLDGKPEFCIRTDLADVVLREKWEPVRYVSTPIALAMLLLPIGFMGMVLYTWTKSPGAGYAAAGYGAVCLYASGYFIARTMQVERLLKRLR
jgi:hypothetical protein